MAEYSIDIWGEMCPIPLIKAKKVLGKMNVGDVLILETEHSCTSRGIEVWAKKNKYLVKVTEIENGIWRLELTKNH